ncbi:13395_t:CDS:2 [Cetraspora pellucida]|uniref:13395_t:CDS:1 n=1 Tax=Cetraspora pellucida TaxID=1433469 RepID=A0A9N9AB33_9GLOM|nr:13395_t:CDS:2 [Cetraspora pellucida]
MFAITIKFITDHKLTNEISLEELSQYMPEILELLTANKEKRHQARNRLIKGQVLVPERPRLKAKEVNICQVLDSTSSKETIKEMAQFQKEHSEQHENERIDFSDYFLLESVKERQNLYDVSNIPDKQTLANEAISFEQLRDPGKLGSIYLSAFLKKDEFIPKTESHKPLLPSSLCKLGAVFAVVSNGAKNLSKAITIAS